jgi:hypothetical protein
MPENEADAPSTTPRLPRRDRGRHDRRGCVAAFHGSGLLYRDGQLVLDGPVACTRFE